MYEVGTFKGAMQKEIFEFKTEWEELLRKYRNPAKINVMDQLLGLSNSSGTKVVFVVVSVSWQGLVVLLAN